MRHLIVPDSDIIEAVGYEAEALEVVFKSSPEVVYRYENVPGGVFAALVAADSIGAKFHELFRKTKHAFTKSERPRPTLKKSVQKVAPATVSRLEDADIDTPREVERLEDALRWIGNNCEDPEMVRHHVSRALRGKSLP